MTVTMLQPAEGVKERFLSLLFKRITTAVGASYSPL